MLKMKSKNQARPMEVSGGGAGAGEGLLASTLISVRPWTGSVTTLLWAVTAAWSAIAWTLL